MRITWTSLARNRSLYFTFRSQGRAKDSRRNRMIECPVNHPALPALFDPMIPDHPALWAVLKGRHTGRAMVDNVEHPTQCVLRTDAALTYSSRQISQAF